MLLQFDATFILIAISFVIFMFVMQAVFYGPITKIRKERHSYVDDRNRQAELAQQKAENLKQGHENEIFDARINASKEVSNSTQQASNEKSQAIEKVNQELSQKISAARDEINNDKSNAKNALKSDVLSLAHMISAKVLGEDVPISGVTNEMIDNILNG